MPHRQCGPVPTQRRRRGGCVCPGRPDDTAFPEQARARMASPVADASRRRREKRRQLDARRSKCRIRLGGHMEQWCLLKERLGFSLHSQLAKFLLDRLGSREGLGRAPRQSPLAHSCSLGFLARAGWACSSPRRSSE